MEITPAANIDAEQSHRDRMRGIRLGQIAEAVAAFKPVTPYLIKTAHGYGATIGEIAAAANHRPDHIRRIVEYRPAR